MTTSLEELRMAADDLCCLAHGYLKFDQADRALVLLLTAMHLCDPSPRLLLMTARCFIALEQADQAQILVERHDRTFGKSSISTFLIARITRALRRQQTKGVDWALRA